MIDLSTATVEDINLLNTGDCVSLDCIVFVFDRDKNGKVFLTTKDSPGLAQPENGKHDVSPNYQERFQHLRSAEHLRGAKPSALDGCALFTPPQLVGIVTSKQYYVG